MRGKGRQAGARAQVELLSEELERTREAAKGDIRTMAVELQGLREQQAALRRQQDAAQARPAQHWPPACEFCIGVAWEDGTWAPLLRRCAGL